MARNDEELRRRRRAVRTALVLAALALAIYLVFFLSMGMN